MDKRFAASVAASKTTREKYGSVGYCTSSHAVALWAVSQEEAIGKALSHALEAYPTKEGWQNHQVSVVEFDK